jgi:ferredoxin-NADP reductase
MTTPLLPDDYLHLLNPLWTARELRGKVVKLVPETADAATLVIKPGWGWPFDYQPGQYVGIGVDVDGTWHWRSYSLSSPPKRDQDHIAITVKAMPEGFLSSHLVGGLEPGTIVRLAAPQGEFVLPEPPPAKLLFWTGGSGITPVMAMLRTLHRRDTMPDVVHVHAAPTEGQIIFRDELHALAAQHPTLRLIENIDETDGILDVDRLTTVVPDWRQRQAWVCGPAPMLDAAERHWNHTGIGKRLHLERFSAVLSASAEGGHVTFGKSGKEADVDGATTLMEAGEAQGIAMPFGCRMGICHTCVIPLKKGRVKDLRNGNEYDDNQNIQTCITAAAGDCTLDI